MVTLSQDSQKSVAPTALPFTSLGRYLLYRPEHTVLADGTHRQFRLCR